MAALAALPALFATVGSTVASAAPTISTITTLAGTAIAARGAMAEGKAAQQAANYEAAQLDIKAKEEQAAAQRDAEQLRRQKNLALSRVTARSAASGFSATDPSTLAIADEIAKYGTVQEQMALYGGKSRRSGYEAAAMAALMSGKAARTASRYKAATTILGGISTLADRFNPRPAEPEPPRYRYGGRVIADQYDYLSGWRTTTKRSGYG